MIPITPEGMSFLNRVAWRVQHYDTFPDADRQPLKQLIGSLGLTQATSGRIYQDETLIARGYVDLVNRRKAIFKELSNG